MGYLDLFIQCVYNNCYLDSLGCVVYAERVCYLAVYFHVAVA